MAQHLNAIVCLVALFLGMFGIQYFVAWPRRSGEISDQSNQKYDTQDLFEWAISFGTKNHEMRGPPVVALLYSNPWFVAHFS